MNNNDPQPPISPPEPRINYGYDEHAYDSAKDDGLIVSFAPPDWVGHYQQRALWIRERIATLPYRAFRIRHLQLALLKLEIAKRGFYVKLITPLNPDKPRYWRVHKIGAIRA